MDRRARELTPHFSHWSRLTTYLEENPHALRDFLLTHNVIVLVVVLHLQCVCQLPEQQKHREFAGAAFRHTTQRGYD